MKRPRSLDLGPAAASAGWLYLWSRAALAVASGSTTPRAAVVGVLDLALEGGHPGSPPVGVVQAWPHVRAWLLGAAVEPGPTVAQDVAGRVSEGVTMGKALVEFFVGAGGLTRSAARKLDKASTPEQRRAVLVEWSDSTGKRLSRADYKRALAGEKPGAPRG